MRGKEGGCECRERGVEWALNILALKLEYPLIKRKSTSSTQKIAYRKEGFSLA